MITMRNALAILAICVVFTSCGQVNLREAQRYDKEGNYKQAINYYNKALQDMPRDSDVRLQYGRMLVRKGDLAEAEKILREAVRLEVVSPQGHSALGDCLLAKKNYEEAKEEFDVALSFDSDHAPAHLGIGKILEAKGDRPAAIEEYRQAVKLDPECIDAYNALGLALNKENDMAGSSEALQAAEDLKRKAAAAEK